MDELIGRHLTARADRDKRRDELLALVSNETRELVGQIELGRTMLREHLLHCAAAIFAADYGMPLAGGDSDPELDSNRSAAEAFDAAVLAYAQALSK